MEGGIHEKPVELTSVSEDKIPVPTPLYPGADGEYHSLSFPVENREEYSLDTFCHSPFESLGLPESKTPDQVAEEILDSSVRKNFSLRGGKRSGKAYWSERRSKKTEKWILDSGATQHMTQSRSFMKDFVQDPQEIGTADKDSVIHSQENGSKLIASSSMNHQLYLTEVAVVPNILENLLSIPRCDRAGAYTLFGNGEAMVTFHDLSYLFAEVEPELTAYLDDENLYVLENKRPCLNVESSNKMDDEAGFPSDNIQALKAGNDGGDTKSVAKKNKVNIASSRKSLREHYAVGDFNTSGL